MNQETTESGLGLSTMRSSGEIAASATAARAKALVEAKYVMAMHRPRNIMQARTRILDACKRPAFADSAIYAKPVGGKTMEGLSIRFAETAIQCMTNIEVSSTTIYEDDDKRILHISLTDLETNTSYGDDITIQKTVERRFLKDGQTAISERLNSKNEKTYLVMATEDDLANKVAAAKSKVIRNSGLRLIPQDILQEATDAIWDTRDKGGGDPKEDTKKIVDAFSTLNVPPTELQSYLGHSLETISPKELKELRSIFAAIRDGEYSWNDYVKERAAQTQVSTPKFDGPQTGKKTDPKKPVDVASTTKTVEPKEPPKEKSPEPTTTAQNSTAAPSDEPKQEKVSQPAQEYTGDNLYEHVRFLMHRDQVNEKSLIKAAQGIKRSDIDRPLAGKSCTEVMGLSEDSCRQIIANWPDYLPQFKA